MQITNITDRLFRLENIVPESVVTQLLELDWLSMPWRRGHAQQHWLRRSLDFGNCAVLEQVHNCIWQAIPQIESQCAIEFESRFPATQWWLDEPGFKVDLHTDGHLNGSIQLFWLAPGPEFGTTFYNSKREHDLLYQFPFVANTGYMMLNGPDPDGSQPLQWHAMLRTVPDNTYRVTSYTHFTNYLTK